MRLLSVLLLHAGVNTFSYVFGQIAPSLDADPLLGILTASAFAVFAAAVLVVDQRRRAAP